MMGIVVSRSMNICRFGSLIWWSDQLLVFGKRQLDLHNPWSKLRLVLAVHDRRIDYNRLLAEYQGRLRIFADVDMSWLDLTI